MQVKAETLLDKKQIRRSFDQAASTYDEAAVLQKEVAQRMLERLQYIHLQPGIVVDIGCGTGFTTQGLMRQYPRAKVVALDLSLAMLQQSRARMPRMKRWLRKPGFLCADAESLPLADQSVDLLFSSLTLQWCNNLEATLAEFKRVLRPGGMLLFSTFGPDTLVELRQSWSMVDSNPHVSHFMDMHDIGDVMLHAGLAEPVMDAERITLTYDDVYDLMHDLKSIGARNASVTRARGLTGKQHFSALKQAYESFRTEGRLPATYEVVYGHAWMVETPAKTGEVSIPVSRFGMTGDRE